MARLCSNQLEDLFRGDYSSLDSASPHIESKVVRIFLSSTFRDFIEERNALAKEVFPYLKTFCSGKGLDFQVIDMRWGVSDTNVSLHQTSEVCLNEIHRCQSLSCGPSFIALLGNRYGYQPLPAKIDKSMFDLLCTLLKEQNTDSTLLDVWYLLDENSVPPVYELQPIQCHFPDFYSADAALREKDRIGWNKVYSVLQNLLQSVAQYGVDKGCLSKEQALIFKRSVTDDEVIHGVMTVDRPSDHCLCYIREMDGLMDNLQDPAAGYYVDVDANSKSVAQQSQDLLYRLKYEKIPNKLPSSSIKSFTVPWASGGIDPSNSKHSQYLKSLCAQVRDDVCAFIERERQSRLQSQLNTTKVLKTVGHEVRHHALFCKSKCECFHGRQYELSAIKSFLNQNSCNPLVLYGPSGSGKTSVMAKVLDQHCAWFGASSVALIRFLGTSPDSSSIATTIASLCYQLCSIYGIDQFSIESMDTQDIFKFFSTLIHTLLPKKVESRLLILFDSIDQLASTDGAHAMNWLPKTLPPNIHIVLSTLPTEHNCLQTLRSILPKDNSKCFLNIQPLPSKTAEQILVAWLNKAKRTLTSSQVGAVLSAFTLNPQPLFLRLLFHQALQWKSYTDCQVLPESTEAALKRLFSCMETDYGRVLVSRSLGYLSVSRNGLSDAELEDVLSLDDRVLDSVYQYWEPPSKDLVRLPSLLWSRIRFFVGDYLVERQVGGKTVLAWFHRQFIEAAQKRYLVSPEDRQSYHFGLCDFFTGLWSGSTPKPLVLSSLGVSLLDTSRGVAAQPNQLSQGLYNLRKLDELPYHVARSQTIIRAKQLVYCNFRWILDKISALPFQDLVQDYTMLSEEKADEEVRTLRDALLLSAYRLKAQPAFLAEQILGRLNEYKNEEYPHIASLLKEAREWMLSSQSCQFVPINQCLVGPGGPLVTTLTGHVAVVQSVCMSPQNNAIVSSSLSSTGGGILNIWNVQSLDCVQLAHSLSLPGTSPLTAHTVYREYVIGGCGTCCSVFNITTGDLVKQFQAHSCVSCLAACERVAGWLAIGLECGCVQILTLPEMFVISTIKNPANDSGILTLSFAATPTQPALIVIPSASQPNLVLHQSDHWAMADSFDSAGTAVIIAALSDCVAPRTDLVAFGSEKGIVSIHHISKPNESLILEGHTQSVKCMRFFLHDSTCLSALSLVSGSMDRTIRVWDPCNGACKQVLSGHSNGIWCVSPLVANVFATGSKDDTLKVWDLQSGKCLQTLEGHSSWISCVDLILVNSEPIIISGSNDKSLKLWKASSIETQRFPRPARHVKQPGCIASSSSGLVVTGADDGWKIWDLTSGQCVHSSDSPVSALCCTEADKLLSAGSDCQLSLWDLSTLKKSALTVHTSVKTSSAITGICCLEGKCILTFHKSGSLQLWSLTLERCGEYQGHGKPVTCAAFSGNQSLVASGSVDATTRVWEVCWAPAQVNPKPVCTFAGHTKTVGCVVFTSRNDRVISGSDDCTLRVWCLRSQACLQVVTYTDSVKCVVLSALDLADERVVAGAHCSRDQLRMWSLESGIAITDYRGHTHAVMCLLTVCEGGLLLSGSRDGTVKLWGVGSGECVASVDLQSQVKHMRVETVGADQLVAVTLKMGPVAFLLLHLSDACNS